MAATIIVLLKKTLSQKLMPRTSIWYEIKKITMDDKNNKDDF